MSGGGTRLSADEHRARAYEHEGLGRLLAESNHDWAAVALFYAAYHHVKAALVEDVIFDDYDSCQALNPGLLPDDRFTTRHQGRKQTSAGREWGINELVLVLYRSAAGTYERLHQASVDVRYQSGLRASVAEVAALYDKFEELRATGALTSPAVYRPEDESRT